MQPNMRMLQQMQHRIQKMQEELGETIIEGTSGGGMVTVQVTGLKVVQGLSINPEAVDPADVGLLEDMILGAVNSALDQAKQISSAEMGKATQGFSLPGLM